MDSNQNQPTDKMGQTPPANPINQPSSPPQSAPSGPPPPTATPSNTPPTSPPPMQDTPKPMDEESDIGVGTPNIGVEKDPPKDEPKEDEPKEEKKDGDFKLVDPPKENTQEEKPEPPKENKPEPKEEEIAPQPPVNQPTPPDNPDDSGGIPPLEEKPDETQAPVDPDEKRIEVELSEEPLTVTHYDRKEKTQVPPPSQKPPQNQPAMPSATPQNTPNQPNNQFPLGDQRQSQVIPPQPPVKAPNSTNAIITVLAVVAVLAGGVGGFYGYRYVDQNKVSADTTASPTATINAEETPTTDTNFWSIYTSTVYNYTLKYPNTWLASTTDPTAESVVFASNQETLAGELTGYKAEITMQEKNGKTLKEWVDTNSATTTETNTAKEITVSDETAYQQELTVNGHHMATYIDRDPKVMIITYSAPDDMFGEGGTWYNDLINSIKLIE